MPEEVSIDDVAPGDVIRLNNLYVGKVFSIDRSNKDLGECADPDCCSEPYYFDVFFEDGNYYWGNGGNQVSKLS